MAEDESNTSPGTTPRQEFALFVGTTTAKTTAIRSSPPFAPFLFTTSVTGSILKKHKHKQAEGEMNKALVSLAILAGLGVPNISFAAAASQYRVVDLGAGTGWDTQQAFGVNDAGQAVGWASVAATNGGQQGFLYTNGLTALLPTLGGYYTRAHAINTSGEVAGYGILTGDTYFHAFSYSGSTLKDLGTLGGNHSYAYGINDRQEIVGDAMLPSGAPHAFLYSDGSMEDLGTLGGWGSWAYDVNNQSQVVGRSVVAGGYDHAFLYSAGTMHDIGTLGGSQSIAYGINEYGQVVGYSTLAPGSGVAHAFLYSAGVMTDLGTLGGLESIAHAVNDDGVVVGYSYVELPNSGQSAFVYDDVNGIQNLNALLDESSTGYYVNEAFGINNNGVIAATASGRAVLLLPVPEPDSYAMMLAGLGMVGLTWRRKKGRVASATK